MVVVVVVVVVLEMTLTHVSIHTRKIPAESQRPIGTALNSGKSAKKTSTAPSP